jgi:hypothetical protein
MTEDLQAFEQYGYRNVCRLANGEVAGIRPMIYTAGLFLGLDQTGWRTRYCYETMVQAQTALEQWDGRGDPPGPWVKQKPEERLGPGATGETI